MATVKVHKNIWGNFGCFIGAQKVQDFGAKYDATDWLSDRLATGQHRLSPKSHITMADIEAHRARLAAPLRTRPSQP